MASLGQRQLGADAKTNQPRALLTASAPNKGLQATAKSLCSCLAVRRESGVEECGNTSGIQVLDEPLELSIIDHSRM